MNQKIVTLIKGIKEAKGQVDGLLALGTDESITKATELNTQMEADMKMIESLRVIDSTTEKMGAFLATPDGDTALHTAATVTGVSDAGSTFLGSHKGKAFVEEFGDGILSERAFKATCQDDYKSAFRSYITKGDRITSAEFKILQEGADAQGGFAVPVDFVSRLIQKSPTPTRVQDHVTVLNTSSDMVNIPVVKNPADDLYTTGIRSVWSGEIPATSATIRATDPTFGLQQFPIYTAMLSLPLTNNLVEDVHFPVMPWIEDKFAETIRLLRENMILNGTGIGQPTGILASPGGNIGGQDQPAVVTLGNPITAAGLIKMAWSVPEQYDMNLNWVFNKTNTGQALAGLLDTTGRPIWGNGLQDNGISLNADGGRGPIHTKTLEGYPVLFQGFMPNTGVNNYPVIFGDLRGYYLINRIGFSIQVLREVYAETNQIMFVGRVRFGGKVAEPFRMKIGQQA